MLYLKRIDPVHPGAPLLIEKLQGSGKGNQGNDNNVGISWLVLQLSSGRHLSWHTQGVNERFGV